MPLRILRRIAVLLLACGLIVVWLISGSGRSALSLRRPPPPSPALIITSPDQVAANRALEIEAERRRADQSLWASELDAERYEDVFLELWDRLRTSSDKAEVLAQFPFRELVLGKETERTSLDHGITRLRLTGPGESIGPSGWLHFVEQLKADGYQLIQSEWRQPKAELSGIGGARSTMALRLDVRNTNRQERIVLRGNLEVLWKDQPGTAVPEVARIEATNLELLIQAGEPAFEQVLSKQISTELNPVFIDPLIVADLNGDELSEVMLVGQNLVYWNEGQGRFQAGKLLQEPVASVDAAVLADFDGDGALDLLGADQDGLILFAGDSRGVFSSPGRRAQFTTAALPNVFVLAAGDVNADGHLDVWLAQNKPTYVAGQMATPYFDANDGFPSFLLLNDGHGTFRDATADAGLAERRFRRTDSASLIDLDVDGDLDLVVVSDFAGVDLYFNDGEGHFTDVSKSVLDETHAFGTGHSFGDYDLDGQLDFLVAGMNSYTAERLDQLGLGPSDLPVDQAMRAKMASGNRLYLREKEGWKQTALSEQVARSGWSWGISSFDFDNDGDLDIYIANGHKSRASAKDYERQFWRHEIHAGRSTPDPALDIYFRGVANRLYGLGQSYGGFEKNRLFMNQSGKSFSEIAFQADLAVELDCRDVVSEDLDNDGKVDLIVTTFEVWPESRQRILLFHNQLRDAGHWIGFHVRAGGPGYSAVGARITLTTPAGQRVRHLVTGDSYRSQHPNTVHFGLGTETRAGSVEIRWPGGQTQRLTNPGIDRYHVLQP